MPSRPTSRPEGLGRCVVTLFEAPERLEVCIADSGGGFDPNLLPEHPPVTDPDRLNFERGLGIPLIRSLVDEARFDSASGGTKVWMTLFGVRTPTTATRPRRSSGWCRPKTDRA